MAQRNTDTFAAVAKHKGKVISLRKEGIIVEYENGERVGVQLGRRYGTAAALTYPFTIVSPLTLGQTVEAGHVIAYNEAFYEPDYLNPGSVVWKSAVPITVALMEAADTYEDSSAVTKAVAAKMSSQITETRDIVLRFDQVIHELVEVGKQVTPTDHLCVIEDGLFTTDDRSTRGLSAKSIETLRMKEADTPRAKVEGTVENIEVIYNGELVDMSDSLRALAERSDRRLAAERRAIGEPVITGQVSPGSSYRVGRQMLTPGVCLVRIYITHTVGYSNGDKAVFGNQLKTVNGDIMDKPMVTESGVQVDGRFGSLAVGARIVWSAMDLGTTSRLMARVDEMVVDAYRGRPVTL